MLTIQNLLRNVYCCIKNISKKLYRSCAILVSGFSVFALILLNDQNFHGAGKNHIAFGSKAARSTEGEIGQEDTEQLVLPSEGSLVMSCKNLLEEGQSQASKDIKEEISKREVTVVCASVQPAHIEMRQEPINPYGEIFISDQDYEALCRIVQAEAGGEDVQGKILVAEVILNRVLSGNFASTVYDVIFERSGGSPQFSPTVDGRYATVTVTSGTVDAVNRHCMGKIFRRVHCFFQHAARQIPMIWHGLTEI